jgi:hypothetical protein
MLVSFQYLSFDFIWVKYVLLLSLLIMFIGLSNIFKKFTDYSESIACLNRAMRSINNIKHKDIQKINFVRFLKISNQINNAIIYINNLVSDYDLYELKSRLLRLRGIKSHYSIDSKTILDKELILEDLQYIEDTLENIKDIKSMNESIN